MIQRKKSVSPWIIATGLIIPIIAGMFSFMPSHDKFPDRDCGSIVYIDRPIGFLSDDFPEGDLNDKLSDPDNATSISEYLDSISEYDKSISRQADSVHWLNRLNVESQIRHAIKYHNIDPFNHHFNGKPPIGKPPKHNCENTVDEPTTLSLIMLAIIAIVIYH